MRRLAQAFIFASLSLLALVPSKAGATQSNSHDIAADLDAANQLIAQINQDMLNGCSDVFDTDVVRFNVDTPAATPDGKVTRKFGFKDVNGRVLIDATYDAVTCFAAGLAGAEKDGKWGYINKFDETVIPFQYADAGPFLHGFAPVKPSTRWGYIDTTGALKIQPQFLEARNFQEDLAVVKTVDAQGQIKSAYIDINANFISGSYDDARDLYLGLGAVKLGGKWGYVNKEGKLAINLIFDETQFSHIGNRTFIAVKYQGFWGFLSLDAKWVATPSFQGVQEFAYAKGVMPAKRQGRWGFINDNFQWQIQPQFESVESFTDDPIYQAYGPVAKVTTAWMVDHDDRGRPFAQYFPQQCRISDLVIDLYGRVVATTSLVYYMLTPEQCSTN